MGGLPILFYTLQRVNLKSPALEVGALLKTLNSSLLFKKVEKIDQATFSTLGTAI